MEWFKPTKLLSLKPSRWLAAAKKSDDLSDEFMGARAELIKLCNLRAVPLRAHPTKTAELQERLKNARKRVLEIVKFLPQDPIQNQV